MSINTTINLSPNVLQNNRSNGQNETVVSMELTANDQNSESQKKNLDKAEMRNITKEMTKFMELINSDIQFQLHDKTKQLIVQVVDTRDGTVLKEFPPHELLDTMAKIREYVGILLDKKA